AAWLCVGTAAAQEYQLADAKQLAALTKALQAYYESSSAGYMDFYEDQPVLKIRAAAEKAAIFTHGEKQYATIKAQDFILYNGERLTPEQWQTWLKPILEEDDPESPERLQVDPNAQRAARVRINYYYAEVVFGNWVAYNDVALLGNDIDLRSRAEGMAAFLE
ncbi:MAG: hypothetical protein CL946_05970, partial [Ectothiorhodospiraceae bacterium]|nr:hypothetical protein [Ectothiorhodospiraceae bacterium]